MTPDAWLAALGTVIGSIIGSWIVVHVTNRDRALADAAWRGEINTKVNSMWMVLFRSATFDGLIGGVLQTKSPIRVNMEAFKQHPDLVEKLKEFYQKEGYKLSDLDLFVQLEANFSEEFTQFETKHGLRAVASVAAACYLLRPDMTIFDHRNFESMSNAYADDPEGPTKRGNA